MFAKFQLCQSIDLAAIQANRKNHDPDWKKWRADGPYVVTTSNQPAPPFHLLSANSRPRPQYFSQ